MFMTSSEIGDYLLKTRQAALRDLATSYVQLLALETQSIDFLVAAVQQRDANHPNLNVAKEAVIKAEEHLTNAIRVSATQEALTLDSFSGCAKGEKSAEAVRARFQAMMKNFETQPSSDLKMAEMQARIDVMEKDGADDPDTSALDAQLTQFATDPLITYLDGKTLEGQQFGIFDKVIARWTGYEAYLKLAKQIEEYRSTHSEVARRRRDRVSELKDIMSSRTTAYRKEARERIAKELNATMTEVEKFDGHDEARQLAVTELYKAVDLFRPAYFLQASALLDLGGGAGADKTAKALQDQMTASSTGSRTAAVALRDKYRKITELFRLIRQHFAFEHRYRFESPLEFDEWLKDETLNAEDILERMIDRVPEVEEKARLRAS
jgi:hypothetical protein